MKHLFLSFIVLTFAILPFCSIARNTNANANANEYAGAPLSFMENKGQVTDQYGKPRTDIDVKLGAGGLNIFIGNGEVHYQFSKSKVKSQKSKEDWDFKNYPGLIQGTYQLTNQPINQSTEIETYRMDVVLVGANKEAELVKEEKQKYYETYYTPATGANGAVVQSYNRVVYRNIYPRIDWILYSKGGELKYDFVVHPGGKVTDIQLRYAGATHMELNNDALIAATPMGSITEAAPVSYEAETGKAVDSRYILEGNMLCYEVTGDSKNGIVIDPVLNWATYYGGGYDDLVSAVATDGNDNAYITGYTNSSNNIATSGAFQSSFPGGQYAAFLAKFDISGSRLWGTYYGGGNLSYTYFDCLTVDAGGNLYAGGSSNITGLATTGAYQTTIQGASDALLVKFSNSGSRTWATYFGDVDSERVISICTDVNNDVFIGGHIWNGDTVTNMVTPGAFQTTPTNGFITKFSNNGTKQWCTSYGDNTCDVYTTSLSCDAASNLVVGGHTTCTNNIASSGAHQTIAAGFDDGFIAKFSSNGARLWASFYGGNLFDYILGVATDPAGNLYIVGQTFHSSSGIASPDAWQPASSGTDDGFLARFDPSGVRQWGTYFGGSGVDRMNSIVLGTNGYLYVSGVTRSTDVIATVGATQATLGGIQDACLQVFTTSGQRVWGSYFGGPGTEVGAGLSYSSLCANPKGKVYIAGSTESNVGIATPGAHQTTLQNTRDGYIAKFDVNDLPPSGISNVNKGGSLGIFPNPNNGNFTLKGKSGSNEPVSIQLINAIGQIVYQTTFKPRNGYIAQDISTKLAPGTYILKAGNEAVKVVVE